MAYKNGKDVLPKRLLEELQQYIQGEIIYIPRKEKVRVPWGEMSGTRSYIDERNNEIFKLYRKGMSIHDLGKYFSLSQDSIRKIIYKESQLLEEVSF